MAGEATGKCIVTRIMVLYYTLGYTPSGRYGHSTVLLYDTLYMWGGVYDGLPFGIHVHDKMSYVSHVDTFTITTGIWSRRPTIGVPPLGVVGYSCTTINNSICYFGGGCYHAPIADICNGFHNSINMLDTDTLRWNELSPTTDDSYVMRRAHGGMISFSSNDEDLAFIIGGRGRPPTTQQPNAIYDASSSSLSGYCVTNECNVFNITTSKYYVLLYVMYNVYYIIIYCTLITNNNYNILYIGKWSVPIISGQCPPPCHGFTLNKLPHNRGIMFGGFPLNNDVFIIELTNDTVVRY